MKAILIDTDVLINFPRGKDKVQEFLLSEAAESVLYCSVITVAEIHAGMLPHEAHKTESLLDSLHIVEVTREIAEKAGNYKRAIKRQQVELMDCLIAATAHAANAFLATGNAKHYTMPDIEVLTVPTR